MLELIIKKYFLLIHFISLFVFCVCREKMEAQMEKESRSQQFRATAHNHSHDSAIDSDLQEWETEILDIDLVCVTFSMLLLGS